MYDDGATLLSLAPELVYAIAERVSKRDRRRLRLTCKHLCDILESQVLHTIYFGIQYNDHSEGIARLQSLAATKDFSRGLSQWGRHLHIKPIHIALALEDGPDVLAREELIRTCIRNALDALQNLKSVTWTPGKKDKAWTHEIIMDFLTSRPSLQMFQVHHKYLRVPVPLYRMQDLQEVIFIGFTSRRRVSPETYNDLARLVASPAGQLTKLSVVYTSLHQIFQFLTPKAEPPRLKDLRMTRSFIKLDSFTIPHLRHLTCLHLLHMKDPDASEDSDISDGSTLESPGGLKNREYRKGSQLSDFWSDLRLARIYLKEISIDDINTGLLGYLACYTGLTKLVVTRRFPSSFLPGSDALATLFFAKGLPSHGKTLEELTIDPHFKDCWCLGEDSMPAFSTCTGLRILKVCISTADLPRARASSHIMEKILDMVSIHMPRLSQLSISPSTAGAFHFSGPRKIYSLNMAAAQPAIDCLLEYPIPLSTIVQFPSVIIWSRRFDPNFVPQSPNELAAGDRSRLRYQEVKEMIYDEE
ncbi:hypothetical protein M413DRAFT_25443 [Hebeloma cylindrosporum]|uniref:Uncharacterized protein n=1 Tax=Hebeloma cylindrosporum TaxID=76867 RepID=A0A0C3CJJ1_HEBCY|nr:hypothetical protein M413DRAFT_25443 [Hebeloma cylindrosporum h7]